MSAVSPGDGEYFGEIAPASHSRKKSEMVSFLADSDTNEDFWPGILSRLADGDFVSTIAGDLKVNHSVLRNWIRGNKAKEDAFVVAEREGKNTRIARVLQKTYETATADIADDPTRMEQLRAAEILLKQDGGDTRTPTQIANIAITFVAANNGRPVEKVIDQLP